MVLSPSLEPLSNFVCAVIAAGFQTASFSRGSLVNGRVSVHG